jgi:hypothetical protein
MKLKNIGLTAFSVLLGAALLADTPETLKAAECEGSGQILCETHESCLNFIFAKFCSTEYEYYNDKARSAF